MVEDLLKGQPEVNILVDGSLTEAGSDIRRLCEGH
jgi:hypothetical protein